MESSAYTNISESTACKPKHETQIGHELELGNTECANLQSFVSEIEIRLASVLRDSPEQPPPAEGNKPEELVSLAHEIRVNRREIGLQASRLKNLLERLEL